MSKSVISVAIYDGVKCFSLDVAGVIADYTFRELPSSGFKFSFRHLPFAYETRHLYLEWLVSISYQLLREYPQYHHHTYNPLVDTIAVIESYILVTLGRLEAADHLINRREIFRGAEEFVEYMHPVIKEYAFRPPSRIWDSPLSPRYLDDAKGEEAIAIGNLRTLMGHASAVKMVAVGEPRIQVKDAYLMAVVEDTFMALLARLQYLHNRAINTSRVGHQIVEEFRRSNQRRFLTKELYNYLDTFQLGHLTELFPIIIKIKK